MLSKTECTFWTDVDSIAFALPNLGFPEGCFTKRFADSFLGDGEDALPREKDAVQDGEERLQPGENALHHGYGGPDDREVVLMTKWIF